MILIQKKNMKVEIALIIHGFIMYSNGIYLGELFGNGQDKDPIKDKVKKFDF